MDTRELRRKATEHATYVSFEARLVKVPAETMLELLDELDSLKLTVKAHESLDRGE